MFPYSQWKIPVHFADALLFRLQLKSRCSEFTESLPWTLTETILSFMTETELQMDILNHGK